MTPRHKIRALVENRLEGNAPRALWRHYPHEDFQPEAFVAASCDFVQRYKMDVAKVTPRSSYGLRDYGSVDVYAGDYLGRPKYMNRVIERPNQWEQLPVLDPHSGFLGQTLGVTRDIVAKLAGEYPVVLTVFSPLTQAGNLAGIDGLMAQWKSEPAVVRAGLQTLTETILRQLRVLEDIGIDGIYLAVQECHWPGVAETGLLAEGHLLNRAILKAAPGWFQMVHVHGQGQHFADYARYPAQLLHWDYKMSGIGHAAGASQFPGIVSGSIVWPLSTEPNGEALIRSQVRQARKSPPRHRELLSSECVIPFETPPQWIEAFVDEADAD